MGFFGRSLFAVVIALSGCHTTAPAGCKASTDCTQGSGVCRDGTCKPVPCSASMACMAGEMCDANGMCQPGGGGTKCAKDADCPPSQGVCRAMMCTSVPCSATMPCMGDEICSSGKCIAPAKATPGQTLAAGGSVSTSAQHIHIGLTGQGRAVGASSSAQHKTVTGATSVMGR